jgi:PKD repeat protein
LGAMNLRGSLLSLSLLLVLCLGLSLGCGKATPTAPSGSVLTLSANPGRITSSTGSSTVTAFLVKSNGAPANPGTQIHFSTNLGTIDSVAETDSSGAARVTLRGDGRIGMATVQATTGTIAAVMVMVPIGTATGSISLQANPPVIESSGGTVTLLALVRDDSGQPLAGVQVNFGTDVGILASGGAGVTTDASGQATDRLTVNANNISAALTMFTVRVNVAGTGGMGGGVSTAMATITIHRVGAGTVTLQATPASIDSAKNNTVQLLAVVRDEQGQPLAGTLVNFGADVGTLSSGGALKKTDANGQVTDTLTVKSEELQNNISSFAVRVQAAGATGTAVTGTFTITVRTSAPVANFTATALGNSKVQFNNTSTGANLTYTWDFGDNSTASTEVSPQHQYPAAGTYTVTLIASSATTGQASTKSLQVVVK